MKIQEFRSEKKKTKSKSKSKKRRKIAEKKFDSFWAFLR